MSSKRRLINFESLKQEHDLRDFDEGHDTLVLSREGFEWLLREYVASFPLDECWYYSLNGDVQQAVKTGATGDPKSHFVTHGYFEGRSFCPADFDEAAYLEQCGDVRAAHEAGKLGDVRSHFANSGYYEGRRY